MNSRRLAIALLLMSPCGAAQADPSWQGFYAGGHFGFATARASADYSVQGLPAISGSETLEGAVFGGQIGYNRQWGRVVLGVETDLMATAQQASATRLCVTAACGIGITQTSQDSIPWLGTLRLRGGVTFGPVLLYGTGGIGYGAFKSTQTLTTTLASVTTTTEELRPAWVAGAGIEAAIDAHWSVKFEYLHLDSGRQSTSYNLLGAGLIDSSSRMTENMVRTGLNYRF